MDIHKNKTTEEVKDYKDYQEISESDSEIYEFLDLHLEKEKIDSFSLGFSKLIIRKIDAKQQRSFNIKIYCCAIFLGLIGVPMLINLLDSEFTLMIFSTVLKYKLTFAFTIIGVILIQFVGKLRTYGKDII